MKSEIKGVRTNPMKRLSQFSTAALLLGLAATGLAGQADLSRLVIVGDSLMAGYQNGSLRGTQQVHGIAALVADQAGVSLPMPLIAEPGIPNALQLIDAGPPPIIAPLPGASAGRMNPFVQPWNLSVPGQTVLDAVSLRPNFPIDSLTDLVLGLPGMLGGTCLSQVEWAEALHPTTIIVWVGPNDTLGAALQADASFVTSEPVFAAAYKELSQRLAATGATLVFANIPDVTVIPYLTSSEDVAAELGAPLAALEPMLGLKPGDFVTPNSLGWIQSILTGSVAGPLPDDVVLTAGEVGTIRAATARFNAIIASEAFANNAALVDIHEFLSTLKQRGSVVHGQRLTTDFLGGIFSLDGFHPTNTGAALTANEFIQALNTRFAAGIPRVNVVKVAEVDPLVLPGVGHPASALTQVDEQTVQALRALVRH
jgi:hypothetical protein